jgi:AhpD family alkylhydroperoxidase
MTARLDYFNAQPHLALKYMDIAKAIEEAGLPAGLLYLVFMRASQINGCAFCLDMHAKDAFAAGEDALRLIALDAWEESPLYTAQERAALAWTEALTRVADGHVPDEAFAAVRPHFTDAELVVLSYAIGQINLWNRMAIAFRSVPGAMDHALEPQRAAKRAQRAKAPF